jgi:MFS transporter, ACS family, tartrate transporter
MSDDRIFAKCAWRLIPFMMVLYAVNLLDRNNVGFAALTMNQDLGFSATVFGFGAGIFFLGFFVFQIPSSLMLERLGARRWIFCILLAWGAISAACSLVQGPIGFYALRFLLGVAEAGFFPGMILYLTYWFPEAYRARFVASFMIAVPLSKILGGPLSGLILQMEGVAGIASWRWLFLIEGLPACLLAFAVLKLLPDRPAQASWLSAEEKSTIAARLAAEEISEHRELGPALRDPRVFAFGLVIFGISLGNDGLNMWLPLIVREMGFSNLATGFVVGLLYLVAALMMVLWARSSDARGERTWHIAIALLFAAVGFAGAALAQSSTLVLLALTLGAMGYNAAYGPFYAQLQSFLAGPAAAGGIALVYATGNIAGFVSPVLIGVIRDATGGYSAAMAMFAVGLILAALLILALGRSLASRAVAIS